MDKIQIKVSTLNNILQYMASKPYAEVISLITEINQQYAEQVKEKDTKGK